MSYTLKNRLLVLLILISSPLFGMTAKLGLGKKLRSRLAITSSSSSNTTKPKMSNTVSLSKTKTQDINSTILNETSSSLSTVQEDVQVDSKKEVSLPKLESICDFLTNTCLLPKKIVTNILAPYLSFSIEEFDYCLALTMLTPSNNALKYIGDNRPKKKFNKDQTHVIGASSGTTAQIWSVATGDVVHTLDHGEWVALAEFSPNGLYALTLSKLAPYADNMHRKSAALWDVVTGERLFFVENCSAQFSPDGTYLIINDKDSVTLWDIKEKKTFKKFQNKLGFCSIKITPDNQYIVAIKNSTFIIWHTQSGLLTAKSCREKISIELSNDSKYFVIHENNSDTLIIVYINGLLCLNLKHREPIHSAFISKDSNYIVTITKNNTITLYDAKTGSALHTLRNEFYSDKQPFNWIEFNHDYTKLITGDCNYVILWDLQTNKFIDRYWDYKGEIVSAKFNNDNSHFIICTRNCFMISGSKKVKILHCIHIENMSTSDHGAFVISEQVKFDADTRKWSQSTILWSPPLIELNIEQLFLLSLIKIYSSEQNKAFSLEELAKAYEQDLKEIQAVWLSLKEDLRNKVSELYDFNLPKKS